MEKSTRLDISYATHQCARFCSDPKESHAQAVKRIGRYLSGTKDKGLILNPNNHSFDCYVDADFCGNWDRLNADVDPSTAKSRTGFVLMYGGCPLTWASKMQREVALSTTEAEYNALSESLREVIFLMKLVEETKDKLKWKVTKKPPVVHCKAFEDNVGALEEPIDSESTEEHCRVFEDNAGALEMAKVPKMRPRTKHLCVRLHHFRGHVSQGKISLHKIPTKFQLADMLTKAQPEDLFVSQRESLMLWNQENTDTLDGQPSQHLRACEIGDQYGV